MLRGIFDGRKSNSILAEAYYYDLLLSQGHAPAWDVWSGTKGRNKVICRNGHECYPSIPGVMNGQGVCVPCGYAERVNPASAESERKFLAVLKESGHEPRYSVWLGVEVPTAVRCVNGHECHPRPHNVLSGQGVCRVCTGKCPDASEAKFLSALADLNASPDYSGWKGVMEKYDVICSEGHKCNPKANNVISGNGVCLTCCGKVWDAFYVVAGNDTVKFGITSGDTRPRLSTHKRDGSPDCLFLRTDLPDGHARNLETAILDALKRAGRAPVRGREYFPADCTDLILDLARAALPETV